MKQYINDILAITSSFIGIADAVIKKRWGVILVCFVLAAFFVVSPEINIDNSEEITYHKIKTDLIEDDSLSNVEAYLIDFNNDSHDELVITYKKDEKPHLRMYYTQKDKIIQLFDKTANISTNNDNPTVCYMITKESQGYSLRERIVEEKNIRNTYYEFDGDSLVTLRNLYEANNYSNIVEELKKYPVVITTDPVHYAITEGEEPLPQM